VTNGGEKFLSEKTSFVKLFHICFFDLYLGIFTSADANDDGDNGDHDEDDVDDREDDDEDDDDD
jgi:hypothetical protein